MAQAQFNSYLLVLGEREAIRWVLRSQRMAFPSYRRSVAALLREGDELLLYVTRNAFHNPTRDRGQVVGMAWVMSRVAPLEEPVSFLGRDYPIGCHLKLEILAPRGQGVDIAPLVDELLVFDGRSSWAAALRTPLVRLPTEDADFLHERLRGRVVKPEDAIPSY
jgi:hypothetical protein